MNSKHNLSDNQGINYFLPSKVQTVAQLTVLLKKSVRTVHSRLKLWKAIRSYNKNGQYYTLACIATFNQYGLWHFGDIHFSRYGNLKQTYINVVTNSPKALTGTEIGNILRMNPQSFLSHFKDIKQVCRQKIAGRYVYYVTENQLIYLTQTKSCISPITDTVGIQILVLRIKFPDYNETEILKLLDKQGIKTSKESLLDFYKKYNIEKKTKVLR